MILTTILISSNVVAQVFVSEQREEKMEEWRQRRRDGRNIAGGARDVYVYLFHLSVLLL